MLVVVESFDTAVARSFRNLPEVQLIKASELNAYDVLCNDWIVFSESNLPKGDARPVADDVATERATSQDPAEGARESDEEREDEPIVHSQDPAEGPRDDDSEPSDDEARRRRRR